MTAPIQQERMDQRGDRRRRACEVVRFGAIGASSTLLYLAIYAVLVFAGVPLALAVAGGFFPVALYGYLMHDRWTFRTKAATRRGLGRWVMLQGTIGVLNTLALWGLVTLAGIDRLVAQVMLLPLLPVVAYLLSRRRVFGAG